MRVSELDKMIATLESLERVDKTADYHKSMAIAYLKNFADCLDDKGVKTIKASRSGNFKGRIVKCTASS